MQFAIGVVGTMWTDTVHLFRLAVSFIRWWNKAMKTIPLPRGTLSYLLTKEKEPVSKWSGLKKDKHSPKLVACAGFFIAIIIKGRVP
jgi:hypothetical protein